MKKPIRKRFQRVKGQRHQAKKTSESTSNVLNRTPEADDGMTPQTSSQGGVFSNSCSEESSAVSNATTAFCMSNSSVIDTCGFHDYTTALSPKTPLPATSQNEASNAETDPLLHEAPESPKCRSSTGQPPEVSIIEGLLTQPCEQTSKSSVSEPLFTQPFEETLKSSVSEPLITQSFEGTSRSDIGFSNIKLPLLPPNLLHEVKCKVKLFLHSRWMPILRQNALHVVLISKQSYLSIQRNLTFSTCGNVVLHVHCKPIEIHPYLAGVHAAFPLSQDNVNEFVDRIITIVEKIRGLEICGGYDDDKFKSGWASCHMGEVDAYPYQECRYVKTFRSKSCVHLVPWSQWRCQECQQLYGPLKRRTSAVSKEEPNLNTGNKYLTEDQMLWKLKEQQKTLKKCKEENFPPGGEDAGIDNKGRCLSRSRFIEGLFGYSQF